MPQTIQTVTWDEHVSLGQRLTALEVSVASLVERVTALEEGGPAPEPEPQPVAILEFKVTPESVQAGQSAAISWRTANATGLHLNGVPIPEGEWASGLRTYNPAATTEYVLAADGHGGPVTQRVTLTVTPVPEPEPPPAGQKLVVLPGESVTLPAGVIRYPDGIDNKGSITITEPCHLIVGKVLSSPGQWNSVGTYKTHMRRSVKNMSAFDNTITLNEPPTRWLVGDKLWVPATTPGTQSEEVEIEGISGAVVTLKTPLQHNHPGAQVPSGYVLQVSTSGISVVQVSGNYLDVLPPVANLTRGIRISDEEGNRCHAIFEPDHGHAFPFAVMICNVEWNLRGITTIETLDGSTPARTIGQYPLHIHHAHGHGSAVMIRGNTFSPYTQAEWAAANKETLPKWILVFHDTEFATAQKNVGRFCGGSAFVIEDGAAKFNVVEDNLFTDTYGNGERLEANAGHNRPGSEGSCYYLAGVHNYFRRNIAMNAGNDSGVNLFPNGINTLPILVAEGFEIWACPTGLGLWRINADENNYNPAQTTRSLLKDTTIINSKEQSVVCYPMAFVDIDGLRVRNSTTGPMNTGLAFGDYMAVDVTVTRADIQGCQAGIYVPMKMGDERIANVEGRFRISDSYLACVVNIAQEPPTGSSVGGFTPRRTFVQNVRHGAESPHHFSISHGHPIEVRDHNGTAGDNFQLYWTGGPSPCQVTRPKVTGAYVCPL